MPARFIGCATDSKFVEPTAVMLSSVDANGNVPDAVVLVASFDINEAHKNIIRIGAGKLVDRLRFIDIDNAVAAETGWKFSEEFPPAVLGRLSIVDHVSESPARLLTLDSDMIVNASLEPLFDLDMEGEYFAAVHDFPRHHDQNYFNSGMTLFDVDTYKYHNVGRRCLEWLKMHSGAIFPDQDALNEVVGHCWYRLDHCWNRHLIEGRWMKLHDFESARIAHFAGRKPWDDETHAGAKLYDRYLTRLRERLKVDTG